MGNKVSSESRTNKGEQITNKEASVRKIQPKLLRQERFYGEKLAYDYLAGNDFNPGMAWGEARNHRNTYKGLREDDRNAEHYLYALSTVMNKDEPAWRMQAANAMYCVAKNDLNIILGDESPFRETTCTADELKAGHYGARDGKKFTKEDLMANVLTIQQKEKADSLMQKNNLQNNQDNDDTIKPSI